MFPSSVAGGPSNLLYKRVAHPSHTCGGGKMKADSGLIDRQKISGNKPIALDKYHPGKPIAPPPVPMRQDLLSPDLSSIIGRLYTLLWGMGGWPTSGWLMALLGMSRWVFSALGIMGLAPL